MATSLRSLSFPPSSSKREYLHAKPEPEITPLAEPGCLSQILRTPVNRPLVVVRRLTLAGTLEPIDYLPWLQATYER